MLTMNEQCNESLSIIFHYNSAAKVTIDLLSYKNTVKTQKYIPLDFQISL